jgi:dynein heavy chain
VLNICEQYCNSLHSQAKEELEMMTEYARVTMGKLTRKVEDLDSLRFMMNLLKEVRAKESSIDLEMNPVMDMYNLLENNLPSDFMDKDEIDKKTMLKSNWKKLVNLALSRSHELTQTQLGFKNGLLEDINSFKVDVLQVCNILLVFERQQRAYVIIMIAFLLSKVPCRF